MTIDWTFVFQAMQATGQIMAAIAAFYAVHLVHNYTKKKDKTEFLRNTWHDQQLINLACLNNEELIEGFEKIVYGKEYIGDIADAKMRFHLFLMINKVQNLYFAWKNNIISGGEFSIRAEGTLRLIKRQEELVKYLLHERGYDKGFANEVIALLANVTPVKPQAARIAAPKCPPQNSPREAA